MANVNIKPLEDRVLVQIVEAETTTASGLVIPDSAKEKPQEATVIAVGPGRWADDDDRMAAQLIHSGASPSGLAAATDPSLEVDIPVVAPE